jgi:hypothetical protein
MASAVRESTRVGASWRKPAHTMDRTPKPAFKQGPRESAAHQAQRRGVQRARAVAVDHEHDQRDEQDRDEDQNLSRKHCAEVALERRAPRRERPQLCSALDLREERLYGVRCELASA